MAELDPVNVYVGYFFDYDVTMMCSTMPEYKIRRLLNRAERFRPGYFTPLPLDIGSYEIDYIKGKFFKVRRATPKEEKNLPWVEISDVGHFFQQSFLKTIIDWNVADLEEIEKIGIGKESRAEFGHMTDEIRYYNSLEIDILERLMNKFRATCRTIRVSPRKWQGPGDIATALLQQHHIPKRDDLALWADDEFKQFVDKTYYGGRFETSAVGIIPGPVYAADINSAYPYAITQVPCLEHGRWEHTGTRPTTDLYVAEGSAEPIDPVAFYGLPFRAQDGGVSFPSAIGVGSYWNFEIAASIHQDFDIADSWSYHRECDCVPFDWVPDLYQKRLQMKKDTQGKVLKLALNSLYGKTAQRIGSAPYNNYVWGSFITAYTRTMLQRFIHSLPSCHEGRCGHNVWMLATDGIYTSELPARFVPDDKLGGWDLKTYPQGIFIVQPGLYYDNGGSRVEARLAKTRGIPANAAVEYEDSLRGTFSELWLSQDPAAHKVKISTVTRADGTVAPFTSFIGLRSAMHRNRPDLAGQWVPAPRNISFSWLGKRQLRTEQCTGFLRTFPKDGSLLEISRPYDKQLAKQLDAQKQGVAQYSDGPDWASGMWSTQEEI